MGRAVSMAVVAFGVAASVGPVPTAVHAHAFAQRHDLPLPLWHHLVGAGAVVVLSFVLVALYARGAGPVPSGHRVALPVAIVDAVARGIAAFGAAALALAGTEARRRHFDPFATVFGLFGRFAPLAIAREGDRAWLVVRAFGAGLHDPADRNRGAVPDAAAVRGRPPATVRRRAGGRCSPSWSPTPCSASGFSRSPSSLCREDEHRGSAMPPVVAFALALALADAWTRGPDLPEVNDHGMAAALDGGVGLFGGQTDPNSTHVDTVHALDTRVPGAGCVHVWGGEEAAGVFPDHDVYDPKGDRWTRLPDTAIPIHGVTGATFADGLIFVTGGGDQVGGNSGTLPNRVYRPAIRCE